MRIVFMGTPEFAVPSLRQLIADGHEIVCVLTQPDKPKNRGMKLMPSPVKVVAMEHQIEVYQPATLKSSEALERLSALKPELIVVAAYGKILPKEILDLPRLGWRKFTGYVMGMLLSFFLLGYGMMWLGRLVGTPLA